jgi:tRNA A37 threonylcarbamoyladenosine biosynthesis protein TsaE
VDCYRLRDPDEAIDLDFPGLQHEARLLLVEWPEKAGGHAPPPDAHLEFSHADDPEQRIVERLK